MMHETGFRLSALDGLLQRSSGCRRHDMDPHLYFMQLLVNLPTWPARDLEGQIERAQRLRRVIEKLKQGDPDRGSSSTGKSLNEQIDERARSEGKATSASDSE